MIEIPAISYWFKQMNENEASVYVCTSLRSEENNVEFIELRSINLNVWK